MGGPQYAPKITQTQQKTKTTKTNRTNQVSNKSYKLMVNCHMGRFIYPRDPIKTYVLTNQTFWRGCSLDCATKYIFVSGFPELTFLLKKQWKQQFANSIYLCYECKWDENATNDIHVKKFTWWGICPAAIHVIPIKRQYMTLGPKF